MGGLSNLEHLREDSDIFKFRPAGIGKAVEKDRGDSIVSNVGYYVMEDLAGLQNAN